MSFGRVFAALFFGALCPGAVVLALFEGLSTPGLVAAAFGLLASLGLATALATGRGWARWVGAGAALAAFLVGGRVALERGGIAELLFVLAALMSAALLLLFGRASQGAGPARGRLCELATGVGVLGLAAMLALAPEPAASDSQQGPLAATRADRVVWADFGTGLARARAEGSPILAHFYAGWCGYCKQMDRETWTHPEVIDRVNGLAAVRINIDQSQPVNGYSGDELAARYGVQGTPSQLLLDTSGRVIAQAGGYQTPGELLRWLDGALNRSAGGRRVGSTAVSGKP